jgi:flagellar hook-length control protein FliK
MAAALPTAASERAAPGETIAPHVEASGVEAAPVATVAVAMGNAPLTQADAPPATAALLQPSSAPMTAPPTLAPMSALPDTPAGPRPMPRMAPAEQVAPVAIALSLGGGKEGRIALILDPAELGRVEVTVERVGDAARVHVAAERPETLALLARDGAALDRALGGAGIGTEGGRSLGFSLLGGDGGGQPMGGGSQGGGQRSGQGWRGPEHGADGVRADITPGRRALLGLLDIAI